MIAWILVIGAWSLAGMAISAFGKTDFFIWIFFIASGVFVLDVIVLAIWLSVWYLQQQQAWPFIPS